MTTAVTLFTYVVMSVTLSRTVSVRIPEELCVRIAALVKQTRRSQGDIVREVRERELANLGWAFRISAKVRDHRVGRVRAVSSDKVDLMLRVNGETSGHALESVS